MKALFFALVLMGWGLGFTHAFAQETRVDATGGLDMVLTDETTELNPYNLGNPAGMALLPAGSRLEMALPWYGVSNADGSIKNSFLSVSQGLNLGFPQIASPYDYQGFLYVPGNDWAFQAFGLFLDENEQQPQVPWSSQLQEELGMVKAANQYGRLSVGAELEFLQYSDDVSESSPYTTTVTEGSLILGLIYNQPLGDEGADRWLRLGGTFMFNVSPAKEIYNFNDIPINLQWIDTNITSEILFEPGLFLDLAKNFEAVIQPEMIHESTTESETNSDPTHYLDEPTFLFQTEDAFDLVMNYKWKIPLNYHGEPQPLTFNQGGLLTVESFTYNNFEPSGSTFSTNTGNSTRFQLGIGLEREKNFTCGIQLEVLSSTGSFQGASGPATQENSFSNTRVIFGGEKWITPELSLRMGFTHVDEQSQLVNGMGGEDITDYFNVYPDEDISGWLWTTGAGYEVKDVRLEGMIFLLEPQSIAMSSQNYSGPAYTYTVFGGEFSIAWKLNL